MTKFLQHAKHMAATRCSAYLPPVQPVLTSQALVPCWSIFSASMEAYFMGCHKRKAPPKQALKVASGSVIPCSVPATCRACHSSQSVSVMAQQVQVKTALQVSHKHDVHGCGGVLRHGQGEKKYDVSMHLPATNAKKLYIWLPLQCSR